MKPLDHLCLVVRSVWPETFLVRSHRYRFQNIAAFKIIVFRKKQRTMERKKRSKGMGWESCYVKKKVRDVWCRNESVRAEIGQILHTHTHTHTHTHARTHARARAAKLVVEI